jgi:hypothetical protein
MPKFIIPRELPLNFKNFFTAYYSYKFVEISVVAFSKKEHFDSIPLEILRNREKFL